MNDIEHNWRDIKDKRGNIILHELTSVDLATKRQCKYKLCAIEAKSAFIHLFDEAKKRNEGLLLQDRKEIFSSNIKSAHSEQNQ